MPAGSTAGPISFVRELFGNVYGCPRGAPGQSSAEGGGIWGILALSNKHFGKFWDLIVNLAIFPQLALPLKPCQKRRNVLASHLLDDHIH